MNIDIMVEHPTFGIGKTTKVSYKGDPLISIVWDDDLRSFYWIEELEFLVVQQ